MFMQEAGIPSLTQERYLLETRGRGAGRHWHVDDEALIRAYRYASSTAPKTAESHASLLRRIVRVATSGTQESACTGIPGCGGDAQQCR